MIGRELDYREFLYLKVVGIIVVYRKTMYRTIHTSVHVHRQITVTQNTVKVILWVVLSLNTTPCKYIITGDSCLSKGACGHERVPN